MKKNSLVLSAGILMIIGAVASLVVSVISVYYAYELVVAIGEVVESEFAELERFVYLFSIISYVFLIVMYLAEFILFLIFGIKLIVKASKRVPLDDYKRLVITAQVFGYVAAGLIIGSEYMTQLLVFATLLTSAILLSVALSKNKKAKETQAVVGENPSESVNVESVNTNIDTNNYAQELTNKIKSVQALKDENVINQEEYVKLIHKVLGIEETKEVKKSTRKTTKTTKGESNED